MGQQPHTHLRQTNNVSHRLSPANIGRLTSEPLDVDGCHLGRVKTARQMTSPFIVGHSRNTVAYGTIIVCVLIAILGKLRCGVERPAWKSGETVQFTSIQLVTLNSSDNESIVALK